MASLEEEAQTSRVLVIGGTGHIDNHIIAAGIHLGYPAAVLIKDVTPIRYVLVFSIIVFF
jgi:hypothetical protein